MHISKGGYPVTLLPPPRRLAPSLGLGTTWVRQPQSGSCHYPTAATKCNVQPSQSHSKRSWWKSMLTHQGWFTALYTQHLLDSQSLEFEICTFPREAIPSHLEPIVEAVLTSTNNQYFGSKIRKKIFIPVLSSFILFTDMLS